MRTLCDEAMKEKGIVKIKEEIIKVKHFPACFFHTTNFLSAILHPCYKLYILSLLRHSRQLHSKEEKSFSRAVFFSFLFSILCNFLQILFTLLYIHFFSIIKDLRNLFFSLFFVILMGFCFDFSVFPFFLNIKKHRCLF